MWKPMQIQDFKRRRRVMDKQGRKGTMRDQACGNLEFIVVRFDYVTPFYDQVLPIGELKVFMHTSSKPAVKR